jgi:hypothetical protein
LVVKYSVTTAISWSLVGNIPCMSLASIDNSCLNQPLLW